MNWFNLGLILDTSGKILLGVTVLLVHWHVSREHKVDGIVLRSMKRERLLGILGILLIIAGSVLQFVYHL